MLRLAGRSTARQLWKSWNSGTRSLTFAPTRVLGKEEGRQKASVDVGTIPVAPPARGSNHRAVITLDNDEVRPYIQPDCYYSPSSSIIGYVIMNNYSVVLNNCVIRGDLAVVKIGIHCVMEDEVVIVAGSIANPNADVVIEDFTQIGAGSVVRSCTIQRFCTIGNGCVIEESAFIGEKCILEPKSVVPAGTQIPIGQVWGGNPAVYKGDVDAYRKTNKKSEMMEMTEMLRYEHSHQFLPYSTAWLEKEKMSGQTVATT